MRRRISDYKISEIIRLHKKDVQIKNIAKRVGFCKSTIERVINYPERYGIEETVTEIHLPKEEVRYLCCSHFGCGKQLSPQEQLFGSTCINHPKSKYDPRHINY